MNQLGTNVRAFPMLISLELIVYRHQVGLARQFTSSKAYLTSFLNRAARKEQFMLKCDVLCWTFSFLRILVWLRGGKKYTRSGIVKVYYSVRPCGSRFSNCLAMYSRHSCISLVPLYSGKQNSKPVLTISSSKRSFLFSMRKTGVSLKVGFAIV